MKKIIYLEFKRLIKSIRFFFDILFFFSRLFKIFEYKKYLSGKNILIIGGSDLNKKKIIYLKKRKIAIATLNQYALTKLSKVIIPNFYFLIDDLRLDFTRKDNLKILKYIKKNNITLIVPLQLKSRIKKKLDKIKIKNILYINASFSRILGFINPIFPRSFSGMTLLSMLSFFLYLDANKIYLTGFKSDIFRNFEVDNLNQSKIKYKSWDKNYTVKKNYSISSFLTAFGIFFYDCERFEKKFPNKIFNLDKTSYITAFKKI